MNTVQVTQSDALEFMATVPDETVDVLITDPPYWTLDKWRNMGTTTRLGGNRENGNQRDEMWFPTIDREYLWRWFLEADRILRIDGHLYVFCDDLVAPILMNWIREAQDEHRFGECHMLIWDKVNQGMGYHYRRRYECIIFAWREPRAGVGSKAKCQRRLRDLGVPDILQAKRVTGGYPTEKPVSVVEQLVRQSARPYATTENARQEVLCDTFAGSGVLAAAVPPEYNARILLNDISDASMRWISKRPIGDVEIPKVALAVVQRQEQFALTSETDHA